MSESTQQTQQTQPSQQMQQSQQTHQLCEALAALKDSSEVQAFLEDLCTIKEIREFGQRLETARLLTAGKSYQEVTGTLQVSSATISRVNKALNYGSGGYAQALEAIKERGNLGDE